MASFLEKSRGRSGLPLATIAVLVVAMCGQMGCHKAEAASPLITDQTQLQNLGAFLDEFQATPRDQAWPFLAKHPKERARLMGAEADPRLKMRFDQIMAAKQGR